MYICIYINIYIYKSIHIDAYPGQLCSKNTVNRLVRHTRRKSTACIVTCKELAFAECQPKRFVAECQPKVCVAFRVTRIGFLFPAKQSIRPPTRHATQPIKDPQ